MLTYAEQQFPTFSFDPSTVRTALRSLEMQGIHAAFKATGIPKGILQGYKRALEGDPPTRPASMPYDERPHAVRSRPSSVGRSIEHSGQKARMIR